MYVDDRVEAKSYNDPVVNENGSRSCRVCEEFLTEIDSKVKCEQCDLWYHMDCFYQRWGNGNVYW